MPESPIRTPARTGRRFSSKRKMQAVVRLLQGEALDALSRELKVQASTLSTWREHVLGAGEAALKSHPGDERDVQLKDLKALVGDLTLRLEVSREAVKRLQEGRPLADGRSSR